MKRPPPIPRTPPTPPQSPRDKLRSAVSDVMQQVDEQREETRAEVVAQRERRRNSKLVRAGQAAVVAVIFVISLLLAIPRWQQPFPAPTGAVAEADARRALVFAAQLVEQHRLARGTPPATFAELGVALPGIDYQRVDSAWVLTTVVEGKTLALRHGQDRAAFLAGQ